jgi:hypothetical protein
MKRRRKKFRIVGLDDIFVFIVVCNYEFENNDRIQRRRDGISPLTGRLRRPLE